MGALVKLEPKADRDGSPWLGACARPRLTMHKKLDAAMHHREKRRVDRDESE